jgi:hypothetical protein
MQSKVSASISGALHASAEAGAVGCDVALGVRANGRAQASNALHFRAQHRIPLDARLHLELPRQIQRLIHECAQELQLEPGFH